MYAYIKFLEGPYRGQKFRVNTCKINHTFLNTNFNDKLKYFTEAKDGKKYKSQIIFLVDEEKELDVLISNTKRVKLLPFNQLNTDTENDERSVTKTKSDLTDVKDSYNSMLSKKLAQVRDSTSSETISRSLSLKEPRVVISTDMENSVKLTDKRKKNISSFSKIIGIEKSILTDIVSDENQIQSTPTPEDNSGLIPLDVNNDEDARQQMSQETNENQSDMINSGYSKFSNEQKSKKDFDQKKKSVLNERLVNIEKFSKLQKDFNLLKNEKKKIENKLHDLKKKLQETEEKLEEYRQLNISLQKMLLEKNEEQHILGDQIKSTENTAEISYSKNYLPVGRIRTVSGNTMVHIGRDQWLDNKVYNNVINKSKDPQKFVGNILLAVFGSDTMKKSTLTGRASNKTSGSSNKHQEKKEFQTLDPTEVAACKEVYNHWLTTEYIKINQNYDHDLFFNNFNDYATKKIAYYKKQPKGTKKQIEKTKTVTKNLTETEKLEETNTELPEGPLQISDTDTNLDEAEDFSPVVSEEE